MNAVNGAALGRRSALEVDLDALVAVGLTQRGELCDHRLLLPPVR